MKNEETRSRIGKVKCSFLYGLLFHDLHVLTDLFIRPVQQTLTLIISATSCLDYRKHPGLYCNSRALIFHVPSDVYFFHKSRRL